MSTLPKFMHMLPLALAVSMLSAVGALRVGEHDEATFELDDEDIGPRFEPYLVASLLRSMMSAPATPCGTLRKLEVNSLNFTVQSWALHPKTKRVVTVGPRQLIIGQLPNGMELSSIGSTDGPFTSVESVTQIIREKELANIRNSEVAGTLKLGFNFGRDLRSCWGDIHDLQGRPVCGEDVLQGLLQGLEKMVPADVHVDGTGQSGSTVVMSLNDFVVKSTKNRMEYNLLIEALPALRADIVSRGRSKPTGAFGSALAPTCVAFETPGSVQWIAQRKIEIPGATEMKVPLGEGVSIGWLDLKSPKFHSMRDGKSVIADKKVWGHKDRGMMTLFPDGLKLRGCGSLDAPYTLEKDAEILLDQRMTDYSLFLNLYQPGDDYEHCVYDTKNYSTWPMVWNVAWPPMQVAVGVIDYIEREARSDVMITSTMKQPVTYKQWWMHMWPTYFHSAMRYWPSNGGSSGDGLPVVLAGLDHMPEETFHQMQEVVFIVRVKWHTAYFGQYRLKFRGMEMPVYHNQTEPDTPTIKHNSYGRSVEPGSKAIVALFMEHYKSYGPSLFVELVGIGLQGLYKVNPTQIILA